jgi:hypothetical protein
LSILMSERMSTTDELERVYTSWELRKTAFE